MPTPRNASANMALPELPNTGQKAPLHSANARFVNDMVCPLIHVIKNIKSAANNKYAISNRSN